MSAHNAPFDLFSNFIKAADPGASGTIYQTRNPQHVPLVAAAAESRTLARPTRTGCFMVLEHQSGAFTITLTVTGGYDETGDTTFSFTDPGQFLVLVSFFDGTNFYWRKISDYASGNLTNAIVAALITAAMDQLTATAAELNATSDVSGRLVTVPAATTTLTLSPATHGDRIVLVQSTGGLAITPPAATGTGNKYEIQILTTVSGGSLTIDAKAGNASDVFRGRAYQLKVGTGETVYAAGATDNLITMDGSTKGGLAGDRIVLWDVATNKWNVNIDSTGSGTVATPFSNH